MAASAAMLVQQQLQSAHNFLSEKLRPYHRPKELLPDFVPHET
jgi:hypothetical protein